MLIHHVFFWLHEPYNEEHVLQLKTGLQALGSIPQVQKLVIGKPASTEVRDVVDNSWQLSELMHFSNLQQQAEYQQHPVHLSFVQQWGHLWKKVLVYDMWVDH